MALMDRLRIDGKVAIVTGAGRGGRRGIALPLAEGGATVVCSAHTQSEIESTAREVRNNGGRAIAIAADVMQESALQALVDATLNSDGGLQDANLPFRLPDLCRVPGTGPEGRGNAGRHSCREVRCRLLPSP